MHHAHHAGSWSILSTLEYACACACREALPICVWLGKFTVKLCVQVGRQAGRVTCCRLMCWSSVFGKEKAAVCHTAAPFLDRAATCHSLPLVHVQEYNASWIQELPGGSFLDTHHFTSSLQHASSKPLPFPPQFLTPTCSMHPRSGTTSCSRSCAMCGGPAHRSLPWLLPCAAASALCLRRTAAVCGYGGLTSRCWPSNQTSWTWKSGGGWKGA